MPDPTTTNLILAQPTRGSDPGTWDTPVNGNTGIIDTCFGSVTTVSVTNVNITLTASQLQASVLHFTGSLTGSIQVNVSAIRKFWIMENITTPAQTITITGGSGNVVALPPGSSVVYWDGTNCNFSNLGKVGELWEYAGTGLPLWVGACTVPPYLNCDGSTFNATTYPLLNIILGGNTLPDLRGKVRATLNQGTGRITTAGSGIDGNTNLSQGGAETVTLTASTIPAHTHGYSGSTGVESATHTHSQQGTFTSGGESASHTHSVSVQQSGTPGAVTNAIGGGWGGTSVTSGTESAGHTHDVTISGVTTTESVNHTHTYSGTTDGGSGGGLAHQNMPPTTICGITMIRAV